MVSRKIPLRARLRLERLEYRDVPAAPVLVGVSARLLGNYLVVTGSVQDESPGQAQVNVSGAVSGAATVRADGTFEFIKASAGGVIQLQAHDIENLDSTAIDESISPPLQNEAPHISITSVAYGASKQITVTGQVYDENPGGLTVTLSNAASGTTTTSSSGAFSVTLTASSLGELRAQTVDGFGLQSNIATYTLTNTKPVISSFTYTALGNNTYRFTGHVADDWSAAGLVVTFGAGFAAVDGKTAVTDANGDFSLTVEIPTLQFGDVWVTVTDCWGLTSDVVLVQFRH